jgi:sirohydrochlorin ferrochelatase
MGSPDVPQGIERCISEGAAHIIVLLNFLYSGKHAGSDIPRLIEQARKKHSGVTFRVTRPIGQTGHLSELFLKMVYE